MQSLQGGGRRPALEQQRAAGCTPGCRRPRGMGHVQVAEQRPSTQQLGHFGEHALRPCAAAGPAPGRRRWRSGPRSLARHPSSAQTCPRSAFAGGRASSGLLRRETARRGGGAASELHVPNTPALGPAPSTGGALLPHASQPGPGRQRSAAGTRLNKALQRLCGVRAAPAEGGVHRAQRRQLLGQLTHHLHACGMVGKAGQG